MYGFRRKVAAGRGHVPPREVARQLLHRAVVVVVVDLEVEADHAAVGDAGGAEDRPRYAKLDGEADAGGVLPYREVARGHDAGELSVLVFAVVPVGGDDELQKCVGAVGGGAIVQPIEVDLDGVVEVGLIVGRARVQTA